MLGFFCAFIFLCPEGNRWTCPFAAGGGKIPGGNKEIASYASQPRSLWWTCSLAGQLKRGADGMAEIPSFRSLRAAVQDLQPPPQD